MTEFIFLLNQKYELGEYSIVPIRYEDRYLIMEWRNQQIYHLRQEKILTKKIQDEYFKNTISKIYQEEKPEQILFSYLKGNKCIGYGGLVHINWNDRNAELSFIMQTELEADEFELHWTNFLKMIDQVATNDLQLIKIYTYAYNLRPRLFSVLEDSNFKLEARLKKHKRIENDFIDILIHSKINE